jgi:hypothetical protein
VENRASSEQNFAVSNSAKRRKNNN